MERFIDHLLLGIEERGTDATGFVAQTATGTTVLDKKDIPASSFIKTRKRLPQNIRSVLLHTRLATQGSPSNWLNNHPVNYGSVFTTHNGTIRNDDRLFDDVLQKPRLAEVDSEIIPALLDHYTFDQAHQAFEKMSGGFATASIDPVRYMGMVLLAKGNSWPLVLHENKHFVIWASTEKAIKEAWGECLGTPSAKYEHLGDGDMVFLSDTVDRQPKSFKYKYTSGYSGGSRTSSYGWYTDADEDFDDGDPWWGYDGGKSSGQSCSAKPNRNYQVLNLMEEVGALRRNGEGTCVTFLTKGEPQNQEFMATYFDDKWVYCPHCKDTIAGLQIMPNTEKWGNICFDCYVIAKREADAVTATTDYLDELGIDLDIFKGVQSIADIQTYLHSQVLYRLARETGIKRTVLDYLLFRATLPYLESNEDISNLYCDIQDRYTEHMADVSAEYLEEQRKELAKKKEKAKQTAHENGWVVCSAGTHRIGQACEACESEYREGSSEEKQYPVIDVDKCLVCKRKSKLIIGTTGAWCKKHGSSCAAGDEPYALKCKNDPIGATYQDGHRWCHSHSRGLKGFIADTDRQARQRLHEERKKVLVH